jgi:uncharacterized protein (TIGR03000 family)
MLSVVLATALATTVSTPGFGFRHGCHGCYGCYGGGFGCRGCYGGCSGWSSCYGGCYGCGGGMSYGCYGGGGGVVYSVGSGGCYGSMSSSPAAGVAGPSGVGSGDETSRKGTPLTAEEQRWLDEMLDHEKDPAKRREIEAEFNADSRMGRVVSYKLFRTGGRMIKGGDAVRKGTPLTAREAVWLKEMMDAEKDPVQRSEIERQFREESHVGRAASYKLFLKDRPDEVSAATVIIRAATDVIVTVNGVRVPRKTERDTFLSPDLPPGGGFSYVVTATATRGGREVTDTRRVRVTAGARTEVDFTSLGAAAMVAEVTVLAPKGTAVRVNGAAYTVSGKKTFQTPELTPGVSYSYTVEADLVRGGETVTETRRVSVAAGKAVTVDFMERTAVAGR